MKTKIYNLVLLTITVTFLFSCDCDTEEVVIEEPRIIEKQISFDTQDDLIKIDGYWLDNSNANWDDWQYEQTIGCRINEGFLS